MRTHEASSNEGTIQLESSFQSCQVHSSESSTEPGRVDIIRVIGPSGEEEDSFRVTVAGELEEGAGCLQETGNEALMQIRTSNKQDEGRYNGSAASDNAVKPEVKLIKEENDTEKGSNISIDKCDADMCEDSVCPEIACTQDRTITNKHVKLSEKLAALVTKLAITEVARFYRKDMREADDTNRPKAHEKLEPAKQGEHLISFNSKIRDYVDDMMMETIQMARKELIDRSRKGLLKLESGNEERKQAKDPEGRQKASIDTSDVGNVYKNNHYPVMNSECASSCDNTMRREDNTVSSDLAKNPERHRVANHTENIPQTDISRMNKINSDIVYRPLNDVVVNDPIKGGTGISNAYNTREKAAKGNICAECTQPETSEHNFVRVTENFAQVLVSNTIQQAISDVCNTNICLLSKINPNGQSQRQVVPKLSQVNTRSKQSILTRKEQAVNSAWAECRSGRSNIDPSEGDLRTETNNELLKCLKETPVQSEEKPDFPGCYAYGENLSRSVIMAALYSTDLTKREASRDGDGSV